MKQSGDPFIFAQVLEFDHVARLRPLTPWCVPGLILQPLGIKIFDVLVRLLDDLIATEAAENEANITFHDLNRSNDIKCSLRKKVREIMLPPALTQVAGF